ncbi:MAG: hypothetical protein NZM65_05050 [Flavobacteriales bacterium]|nr:hypothetical protein [Flavobacteriales bacterium]MDW8410039.1 hypothetical protein [Flavobacteriales bacterium]
MKFSPRVLVVALDWGWGHASRSIPVVRAFQKAGFRVWVGASGDQIDFYKKEIGDVAIFSMPGYEVRYSKYLPLTLGLLLRSPLFFAKFLEERRFVRRWAQIHRPHIVISDSRPGCCVPGPYNIYITHQVEVIVTRCKPVDRVVSDFHRWMTRSYDEIWVPDVPERMGLSGNLGHPRQDSTRLRYVGWLSRFSPLSPSHNYKYDVCFTLSGPEPHRSRFEERILAGIHQFPGHRFALVRGTLKPSKIRWPSNVDVWDLAPVALLQELWQQSRTHVCRAGYSTLMDLAKAGCTAWIVPTPGQPEQQYLARLHERLGSFKVCREEALPWKEFLSASPHPSHPLHGGQNLLELAVEDLKQRLFRIKKITV